MKKFEIKDLKPDRVAQAYPLVQAALPRVSLDAWRHYASTFLTGGQTARCGILTVVDVQDCIVGLCVYRIESDLAHGRVLIVDHIVALDLFRRAAVIAEILSGVEHLARSAGCSAIHTTVANRPPGEPAVPDGMLAELDSRGHRVEGLRFCRVVAAAE
ncbi:MAG TPA: hypothetical protein VLL72_10550 [Kiloniellales bacterium]|nr:hypothetical protein [Kiloniellales bacterium]